MFEDTKGVIRSRKWKKGRQCSGYVRRYLISLQKKIMIIICVAVLIVIICATFGGVFG
jgi:hypothetical protein